MQGVLQGTRLQQFTPRSELIRGDVHCPCESLGASPERQSRADDAGWPKGGAPQPGLAFITRAK